MGRKAIKKAAPSNNEVKKKLQARNPADKFVVCEACGDWALVWPGNPYSGMHPMGCFDTPRGQRIANEMRRSKKRATDADSLFDAAD